MGINCLIGPQEKDGPREKNSGGDQQPLSSFAFTHAKVGISGGRKGHFGSTKTAVVSRIHTHQEDATVQT